MPFPEKSKSSSVLAAGFLDTIAARGVAQSRAQNAPELFGEPYEVELNSINHGRGGLVLENQWLMMPFDEVQHAPPTVGNQL